MIALTAILKKAAEYEDVKWLYFRVIKWVIAMQNAPINTNKTPWNDKPLEPKGSADITTPKKPINIAITLTKFMLSLRKKCDMTKSIKGDVNNTGYTIERGRSKTPFKTKRKPTVWTIPLVIWKV